mgnify:CR=1 FL=1
MKKIPMTKASYETVKEELEVLKRDERPAIIQSIADARDLGDLSENAEYHAAREKQGFLEARIGELENMIACAEVVDISLLSGKKVSFGATVKLCDEETEEEKSYKIVGEAEADISKSLVSYLSPIAKSLMGKEPEDRVEVRTPAGIKAYEIIDVAFIE